MRMYVHTDVRTQACARAYRPYPEIRERVRIRFRRQDFKKIRLPFRSRTCLLVLLRFPFRLRPINSKRTRFPYRPSRTSIPVPVPEGMETVYTVT